jgi:hypothetical protein
MGHAHHVYSCDISVCPCVKARLSPLKEEAFSAGRIEVKAE